jgi:hypothetical protein
MAKNLLFCALISMVKATFDCSFFETNEAYGQGALTKVKEYIEQVNNEAKFDLQ